jgi:Rrf2 family protein
MIFSKTTGYGIRALAYLARQPKSCLCRLQDIAEKEKIPAVYLRKVLGELRRHRLLHSVKGIHGGYELLRQPETITLWEIYGILDPDPYFDQCILGHSICEDNSSCVLHEEWKLLRKQFVELLRSKTIAQIACCENKEDEDWREALHINTNFRDEDK